MLKLVVRTSAGSRPLNSAATLASPIPMVTSTSKPGDQLCCPFASQPHIAGLYRVSLDAAGRKLFADVCG
jgi:hypothetical protein